MRKAQMEMVGLVIIVILITLGILIFAAVEVGKGSQEKKIFTRKELAYSTLSALMKTTIEEGICGVDFRPEMEVDILEDCASHYPPENIFSDYHCEYDSEMVHSCVFFKNVAEELLDDTLGKRLNKRYEMQSQLIPYQAATEEEIDTIITIKSSRGGCPATQERDTSTFFPLTIEGIGQVQSVLYICD